MWELRRIVLASMSMAPGHTWRMHDWWKEYDCQMNMRMAVRSPHILALPGTCHPSARVAARGRYVNTFGRVGAMCACLWPRVGHMRCRVVVRGQYIYIYTFGRVWAICASIWPLGGHLCIRVAARGRSVYAHGRAWATCACVASCADHMSMRMAVRGRYILMYAKDLSDMVIGRPRLRSPPSRNPPFRRASNYGDLEPSKTR